MTKNKTQINIKFENSNNKRFEILELIIGTYLVFIIWLLGFRKEIIFYHNNQRHQRSIK